MILLEEQNKAYCVGIITCHRNSIHTVQLNSQNQEALLQWIFYQAMR